MLFTILLAELEQAEPSLRESLGPAAMFLAGIALLTLLLLRRAYRQMGSRRRGYDARPIDAQPRPQDAWSGAHRDVTAVIERQKVELAEFQREVQGQVDTKLLMLRELIRRSAQQIDRMEELLEELQQQEHPSTPFPKTET